MILLLWACSGGDSAADSGPCASAPLVTWDNFGRGFLTENCSTCHAATAPDRHGAPDDVVLDTAAEAWAWKDRILARSAVTPPTMPPEGGISADDQTKLQDWLVCGTAGE
jgi:uncharacterized membrane protein